MVYRAASKHDQRRNSDITGSLAGAFARATGSSVPVTDGGTSAEHNGIIVSELHRNIVPLDSDLSSSGGGARDVDSNRQGPGSNFCHNAKGRGHGSEMLGSQ